MSGHRDFRSNINVKDYIVSDLSHSPLIKGRSCCFRILEQPLILSLGLLRFNCLGYEISLVGHLKQVEIGGDGYNPPRIEGK